MNETETKPGAILDPHWRRMDELFCDADLAALGNLCALTWARNEPIPAKLRETALAESSFLIAAEPVVDRAVLNAAPNLKAVIEVSGAFPDTIDYAACAARGVEVLSCAPGFRESVAEMAVAMALSGARGLVSEHELFRRGNEHWLSDNSGQDFTLLGADIGFVGYGSIARETHRVLAPFSVNARAYDPWLDTAKGVTLAPLDEVLATSRCLFVTAAPSAENKGLIDADALARLPDGALVVLISRAHLVDFDALTAAALSGRIRVAVDVFPDEPLSGDHPIRHAANVILSPHRAAAVDGGRQLIGRMILADIERMLAGHPPRDLQRAALMPVDKLTGVGDAKKVADMAATRK